MGGEPRVMPALSVTSQMGHYAMESDLGGQSHVQVTGSTDSPRYGQGTNQGQEPSREPRQEQQEMRTEMERMEETRAHSSGFRNLNYPSHAAQMAFKLPCLARDGNGLQLWPYCPLH